MFCVDFEAFFARKQLFFVNRKELKIIPRISDKDEKK